MIKKLHLVILVIFILIVITSCNSINEPTCTWMPADTTDHGIIQVGICV